MKRVAPTAVSFQNPKPWRSEESFVERLERVVAALEDFVADLEDLAEDEVCEVKSDSSQESLDQN